VEKAVVKITTIGYPLLIYIKSILKNLLSNKNSGILLNDGIEIITLFIYFSLKI